jgi:vacuolar-type H+-ATPase subunit I/STV1
MTSLIHIQRLQRLIWVLIYGGLLTLVLGLSMQRSDDALGWSMVTAGALLALVGAVLIYVRSRMKVD